MSVIQGSAIGPVSYVVNASDLRTINSDNKLVKFADGTYLLVPSANSHTCESGIERVNGWAMSNNLGLNQSKSMEMIITAPGMRGAKIRTHLPPPLMHAIERVRSFTMLRVIINDRISADEHVTNTIATCSKSLYALRVLRAHGMPTQALHSVGLYRATGSVQIATSQPSLVRLPQCSRQKQNRFVHQPQQAKWLLCGFMFHQSQNYSPTQTIHC